MAIKLGNRIGKPSSSMEWEPAPIKFSKRAGILAVYGETDTGKTSFALSAPGPIALIHTAEKIDGVVQQFAAKKDIRMFNFGGTFTGTPQEISEQANKVLAKMRAHLTDAIKWARTVVLDTHTEAWELLRLARFGKLAQVKPIHYGPVNAEWLSMMKMFRQAGANVNLIAVGQIREKYVNDKPTGRFEQAGQKGMSYLPDVIVLTERTKKGGFVGTIEKGWMNAETEGLEIEDDMLTFAQVMGLVTGTDADEWE